MDGVAIVSNVAIDNKYDSVAIVSGGRRIISNVANDSKDATVVSY